MRHSYLPEKNCFINKNYKIIPLNNQTQVVSLRTEVYSANNKEVALKRNRNWNHHNNLRREDVENIFVTLRNLVKRTLKKYK